MQRIFLSLSRIATKAAGIFLLAAVLTLAGCKHGPEDKPIVFEGEFSVNVAPVPSYWPREKLDWPPDPIMRRNMEETLAIKGRPDYFREIFTIDRRIIRPSEFKKDTVMVGRLDAPRTQWIYFDEAIAVEFEDKKMTEFPLSDAVKTVCLYGDPHDVKDWHDTGANMVEFIYYSQGKAFTFDGEKLVKERAFRPMDAWGSRF